MTMPIDLMFERHAESDGNVGSRLLKAGRYDEIPEELRTVPGWQWRLTDEGRRQCEAASRWHAENLPPGFFGKGYVSWYVRARETAGLLRVPGIEWSPNYFIREREYGELDCLPTLENMEKHRLERERKKTDRMFWVPGSGESTADLLIRVDRMFDTLHRQCSEDRVLILTHGDWMMAGRVVLECISPESFQRMEEDPGCTIHNCGILHYTRQNPHDLREIRPHLSWVRYINPMDPPSDPSLCWREIERHKYTSEELLEQIARYPQYF